MANGNVAGTILPDKLDKLKVKGLQFRGEVLKDHEISSRASRLYHLRYPMALLIPGQIWAVRVLSIKYTDSAMRFGKKLLWEAGSPAGLPESYI